MFTRTNTDKFFTLILMHTLNESISIEQPNSGRGQHPAGAPRRNLMRYVQDELVRPVSFGKFSENVG